MEPAGAAGRRRLLQFVADLRQAGEPGVRINLQLESFILESGGTISGTLDELVAALQGAVAGAPARRAS